MNCGSFGSVHGATPHLRLDVGVIPLNVRSAGAMMLPTLTTSRCCNPLQRQTENSRLLKFIPNHRPMGWITTGNQPKTATSLTLLQSQTDSIIIPKK